MSFWKCYYHIIWTTKHRQPWITPPVEKVIYDAIERKCGFLGCKLLAINGTADHVHIALTIPPGQAVAYVIGQIKGGASWEVNQAFDLDERFQWQGGYGVLTFGEKVMPQVIAYIAEQKQKHEQGTISAYMEHVEE